ncbi:GNAT family N-acetyltransferase [Herbiconiux sp.]|uniref:GNAT family N-acetyltransferase n=1 Tax=Herbiconiux sp. TaxID=1871186 RepID=UPI0025BF1F38|nr:GNAT family N-acetyltransferase [Herbiconiux sp.]
MTSTIVLELWSPGTPVDAAVASLLFGYHRQTEQEKGRAVETAADLPERYRTEVENTAAAFADCSLLLARTADGEPVGCVVLTAAGSDGALPEVKRLWVDPAARGLGVATALLDAAAERAHRRGDGGVRLSVWEWREGAIRLYERAGFVRTDSWDDREGLICLERVTG